MNSNVFQRHSLNGRSTNPQRDSLRQRLQESEAFNAKLMGLIDNLWRFIDERHQPEGETKT